MSEYLLHIAVRNIEGAISEVFLRNLLLNENHPLHNRALHISGTFKISSKANIEDQKANIESSFSAKTASHVYKLLEKFGCQTIFGRSDVQKILNLKPTRSSELMKEMTENRQYLLQF